MFIFTTKTKKKTKYFLGCGPLCILIPTLRGPLRHSVNLAWNVSSKKLSCLAVCQLTRSLIGVAMAEGVCVEWVSNRSVSDDVAHAAVPLFLHA